MVSSSVAGASTVRPMGVSRSPIQVDVGDAGARCAGRSVPSASSVAAISLSTEFLAPPMGIDALEGPARAHDQRAHRPSMVLPPATRPGRTGRRQRSPLEHRHVTRPEARPARRTCSPAARDDASWSWRRPAATDGSAAPRARSRRYERDRRRRRPTAIRVAERIDYDAGHPGLGSRSSGGPCGRRLARGPTPSQPGGCRPTGSTPRPPSPCACLARLHPDRAATRARSSPRRSPSRPTSSTPRTAPRASRSPPPGSAC